MGRNRSPDRRFRFCSPDRRLIRRTQIPKGKIVSGPLLFAHKQSRSQKRLGSWHGERRGHGCRRRRRKPRWRGRRDSERPDAEAAGGGDGGPTAAATSAAPTAPAGATPPPTAAPTAPTAAPTGPTPRPTGSGAAGAYATAMNPIDSANGACALAANLGTLADARSTLAFGDGAKAYQENSIAGGYSSTATGLYSLALGSEGVDHNTNANPNSGCAVTCGQRRQRPAARAGRRPRTWPPSRPSSRRCVLATCRADKHAFFRHNPFSAALTTIHHIIL